MNRVIHRVYHLAWDCPLSHQYVGVTSGTIDSRILQHARRGSYAIRQHFQYLGPPRWRELARFNSRRDALVYEQNAIVSVKYAPNLNGGFAMHKAGYCGLPPVTVRRNKKRTLTEEEKSEICRLFSEGHVSGEIAGIFDISASEARNLYVEHSVWHSPLDTAEFWNKRIIERDIEELKECLSQPRE